MKKYEIYLPLKYNDGKQIEPHKIKKVRQELIAVFGALTVRSLCSPLCVPLKFSHCALEKTS